LSSFHISLLYFPGQRVLTKLTLAGLYWV